MLVIQWVSENYIELIAAALGLLAISLQIRQNVWYWLVSIIMVSMYIYVYIQSKLYADMSLQVYYLVVSFYGWYYWLHGGKQKDKQKSEAPVRKSPEKLKLILLSISIVLFFFIAWILINFTDSDVPWWDSFTTSLSFVATWMLAKKYIENWLIWIVVDATSVGIYIYKGLYPTTILFAVLTVLAFVGYLAWLKDMKKESAS
ncbi:MAG: nicotinamide riboside transporter PnuC [Bacteroidales bacterium]|nr:nicotinamide riboside transporter PnuC [Bacteroidales bacterium]MCF8386912.1 nicotinamide riboside transporter PnuC [Bacteroidales bacterium]MCF8396995.1 nicotinamide riboside transporter PnuC [Bacteroidales bacterium]